jgi:two-component system chemotaxis response regulator CheY
MNILIVDDSRAMRLIVRRTLRQAGFEGLDVEEACTGKEALTMIRGKTYHLVLSDWNMPEMSGIDLLTTLRKEGNKVTFGFITSEGTGDMRLRASEAGAQFLIAKPFSPETLAEALSGIL